MFQSFPLFKNLYKKSNNQADMYLCVSDVGPEYQGIGRTCVSSELLNDS